MFGGVRRLQPTDRLAQQPQASVVLDPVAEVLQPDRRMSQQQSLGPKQVAADLVEADLVGDVEEQLCGGRSYATA
jgi:hypothetical protein